VKPTLPSPTFGVPVYQNRTWAGAVAVLPPLPTGTSGRDALTVAREAALRAGHILRRYFHSPVAIASKGGRDLVTEADKAAEQEVLAFLRQEFPSFGTLSEEEAGAPPSTPSFWLLDPLDGTRNLAHGIPYFGVSLALASDGEVLLGVVYDPLREELYQAVRGGGATCNGSPLRVDPQTDLSQAILACDLGYRDETALWALSLLHALFPRLGAVRIMGSIALGLASVAAGRVNLYFHPRASPWDIAAGTLLVREAGGEVTDLSGRPATLFTASVAAGNPSLLRKFWALLPPPP
jgi:myo-inositol-1(or 4)-monophosphatase